MYAQLHRHTHKTKNVVTYHPININVSNERIPPYYSMLLPSLTFGIQCNLLFVEYMRHTETHLKHDGSVQLYDGNRSFDTLILIEVTTIFVLCAHIHPHSEA